jgi:hypothetical protein
MSTLLDIYNELNAELFSDLYQQNLVNNIMELTLEQENAHKQILSEMGEKQLKQVYYKPDIYSMKHCPITLNEFKEGDIVTALPCNHIFDSSGILVWLKTESAKCPVCRKALDSIEINNKKADINSLVMDNSNTIFQTNPLSLFSNITIDLSLNPHLQEPYSRDYNISDLDLSNYNMDAEITGDDIFYNTLQFIEQENAILNEVDRIFAIDLSFN